MTIIRRSKKEKSRKVKNKFNVLITDAQQAKLVAVRDLGFNVQVLIRAELDSALTRIMNKHSMAE